jgi:hypothetical protein
MCSFCNAIHVLHKSLGGLSHHPVEKMTKTKKRIIKKHAKLQYWKGLDVNQNKRICKAH